MGWNRRAAVVLAAGMVAAGWFPAAAEAEAGDVGCGSVITRSTRLGGDVGPCTGDGLIVRARGKAVVLDLNGHSIVGDHSAATAETPEHVGVRVVGGSGVVVRNGTVRGFEAGVAVMGGSGNTVSDLEVRGNTNALRVGGPDCLFGDGVVLFNSDGNTITRNRVVGNGPFSGISLVGDSDANVVDGNQVLDNMVANVRPDGSTGPCGRARQDVGIRLEGPGADGNLLLANQVQRNQLAGIAIHGYVCQPPDGSPPEPNNGGNTVRANTVVSNGYAALTELGSGIAALEQGPAGVVCVAHGNSIVENTSTANAQDGIFVGGRGTRDNTISGNVVDRNGRDGIHLNEGAVNNTLTGNRGGTGGLNTLFDGYDGNVDCDGNGWTGNVFVKANQPCVSGG